MLTLSYIGLQLLLPIQRNKNLPYLKIPKEDIEEELKKQIQHIFLLVNGLTKFLFKGIWFWVLRDNKVTGGKINPLKEIWDMSVDGLKFSLKDLQLVGISTQINPIILHFLIMQEKQGSRPSWICNAALFPLFFIISGRRKGVKYFNREHYKKKPFITHINIMYGRLPVIIQLMITGVFMYSTDSLELTT